MQISLLYRILGACLLALAGPARAADTAPEVTADNVVIILDASGSMEGRMRSPDSGQSTMKMDAAKTALKQVLQHLPAHVHVGLLVFSGANVPQEWLYPLGPRDNARLMEAIDQPRPNGGTPLGAYIKKGADRLLQERERQFGYGTYRLLIVTDGEAQDQDLVDRFTPEVVARGITVDVIGVAMNQKHTLATRVHSYRAANDPQTLRRALAEVFGEVSRGSQDTAADDVFALLAPIPEGVAVAAIQALSTSGNQPIGQRPRPAPTPPPSAQPPAPPPAPVLPIPGPVHHIGFVWGGLGGLFCCGLGTLVLAAIIVRLVRGSRK